MGVTATVAAMPSLGTTVQSAPELTAQILGGATQGYVDAQDAATLASAKTYADAHTGDKSYTHTQATASSTWTITHGMAKHPSVTVVDSSGNEVIGAVDYTDDNSLTVTFSAAFAGTAYCN